MKTLLLIESGRTQLVLQPEGSHDQAVAKVLETLPNAKRANFYQTQGGWTAYRDGGSYGHVSRADAYPDLILIFDTATVAQDW